MKSSVELLERHVLPDPNVSSCVTEIHPLYFQCCWTYKCKMQSYYVVAIISHYKCGLLMCLPPWHWRKCDLIKSVVYLDTLECWAHTNWCWRWFFISPVESWHGEKFLRHTMDFIQASRVSSSHVLSKRSLFRKCQCPENQIMVLELPFESHYNCERWLLSKITQLMLVVDAIKDRGRWLRVMFWWVYTWQIYLVNTQSCLHYYTNDSD